MTYISGISRQLKGKFMQRRMLTVLFSALIFACLSTLSLADEKPGIAKLHKFKIGDTITVNVTDNSMTDGIILYSVKAKIAQIQSDGKVTISGSWTTVTSKHKKTVGSISGHIQPEKITPDNMATTKDIHDLRIKKHFVTLKPTQKNIFRRVWFPRIWFG